MNEIFKFVLASFVIFAFGIGLILLVYFTTKKRRYINKNGLEVEGEVIGDRAFYNPGKTTVLGTEYTSYYLSCKYITQNNEEITKEFTDVSYRKDYLLRHPVGSKIKILYLPENPYQSIIKDTFLDFGLFFMQILGISLFALSASILYYGIMITYFS